MFADGKKVVQTCSFRVISGKEIIACNIPLSVISELISSLPCKKQSWYALYIKCFSFEVIYTSRLVVSPKILSSAVQPNFYKTNLMFYLRFSFNVPKNRKLITVVVSLGNTNHISSCVCFVFWLRLVQKITQRSFWPTRSRFPSTNTGTLTLLQCLTSGWRTTNTQKGYRKALRRNYSVCVCVWE